MAVTLASKILKKEIKTAIYDHSPTNEGFIRECMVDAFQSFEEHSMSEEVDEDIIDRNKNWLPKIQKYHNEEISTVLFSVGIAHVRGLASMLFSSSFKIIATKDFRQLNVAEMEEADITPKQLIFYPQKIHKVQKDVAFEQWTANHNKI